MYVWKTKDPSTLCAPETKSKTSENPCKTKFRLFPCGGASVAGAAFPLKKYGTFPFWKKCRIFYVVTIP